MADDTFGRFIDQQTAPTEEPKVDRGQEREEWQQYLCQFYGLVESFMPQYIDQDRVRVRYGTKELNESPFGTYSVKTMALEIGRNNIEFVSGSNVLGAKGRVDMRGGRGTVKFVLVPEGTTRPRLRTRIICEGAEPVSEPIEPVKNWEWKIATPPPNVRCLDLCEKSFQEAIMKVIKG